MFLHVPLWHYFFCFASYRHFIVWPGRFFIPRAEYISCCLGSGLVLFLTWTVLPFLHSMVWILTRDTGLTQEFADTRPATADFLLLQFEPYTMHQMVCQHCNKQMSSNPVGNLVMNRTQSKFGYQRTEYRFNIRQHG